MDADRLGATSIEESLQSLPYVPASTVLVQGEDAVRLKAARVPLTGRPKILSRSGLSSGRGSGSRPSLHAETLHVSVRRLLFSSSSSRATTAVSRLNFGVLVREVTVHVKEWLHYG